MITGRSDVDPRSTAVLKSIFYKPTAAGLLLWARRAGDIDRLLQQRRVAGEWGSAMLSAHRGS